MMDIGTHALLTSGEPQAPEVAARESILQKKKIPSMAKNNYPSPRKEHDYNILANSVA
jgi:hypothetical protein